MLELGSFSATPNAADWSEYIEVLDDDDGTPFDLTGILIELEVCDQNGCRRLYGSTSDGTLSLIADGFDFTFTAAQMRNLCAGSYGVFVRMTDSSDGAVYEPITATLPVIFGGFR